MQDVPTSIVRRFAASFCYGRSGYTLRELECLFVRYQSDVPGVDPGQPPTKGDYFGQCVRSMTPEAQRQFLYDLCDDPPSASGPLPDSGQRGKLLRALAGADGMSPLGVELSALSLDGVRKQWFVAASRLGGSPSSAITAARALVETTCKTIVTERGETPNSSGDLGRLFRQTRQVLQIDASSGMSQGVHQMANGLSQVIDGLAGLSNRGGDRHGLPGGLRITDRSIAALAIHAAGTVSLFLVQTHRRDMRVREQSL
jgi:hypothetical protein